MNDTPTIDLPGAAEPLRFTPRLLMENVMLDAGHAHAAPPAFELTLIDIDAAAIAAPYASPAPRRALARARGREA